MERPGWRPTARPLGRRPAVADCPASSLTGVPARRAQPGCSGPSSVNMIVISGTAVTATAMVSGRGATSGKDSRHHTAQATAATAAASRASSQGSRLSVPVPRPCQSATGQAT